MATVARRVHARVAYFTMDPGSSPLLTRHRRAGGRAWVLDRGPLVEWDGTEAHPLLDVADIPIALDGLARHNVANALAAAGGARALGATGQVAKGLRDFRPSAELSPGRSTCSASVANDHRGLRAQRGGHRGDPGGRVGDRWRGCGTSAPVTAIIGTAGDRPDDTLRGIGRMTAQAQQVVIKETLAYLRGRDRDEVVRVIGEGLAEGGLDPATVPVYESETAALEAELVGAGSVAADGRPDAPRVLVLFCHQDRDEVFALLKRLGAHGVDVATELGDLAPRLADRKRPGA